MPWRLTHSLRQAGRNILDIILPPQSLLTGAPSHSREIESELWSALTFLDEPCCARCGFPFEFDLALSVGEPSLCGACMARPPIYDRARAAFAYDDISRQLVLDFKHGGRMSGLPVFAAHMARAGRHILDEADMIVPVPLHRFRLLKRRYNQSALLARALAQYVSSEPEDIATIFAPDILQRVKNTKSQGGKSARERYDNLRGAFAVRPAALAHISGKHIVIIDDVVTTGATLNGCAHVLKAAGAARVDALCLARVVKAADPLT